MAEAGEYHVEMVAKGDVVEIYLADHDNKAVSAAGHKAVAILVIDGKSQRIVLEPAGDTKLSGKASFSIAGFTQGRRPDYAAQRQDGAGAVQLGRAVRRTG